MGYIVLAAELVGLFCFWLRTAEKNYRMYKCATQQKHQSNSLVRLKKIFLIS